MFRKVVLVPEVEGIVDMEIYHLRLAECRLTKWGYVGILQRPIPGNYDVFGY